MSNKDDFDTTYRKVKGFHIIGYDADTDTFSKLHVDQNGHIYTKMLGEYDSAAIELGANSAGDLKVTLDSETVDISDRAARDLGKVDVASLDQYTPVSGRLPVDGSGVTQPVSATDLDIRNLASTQDNLQIKDNLSFQADCTPNNELITTDKIRLVGTIFDGSALDASFYTNAVSTGTVAQTGSELILTSGTANGHYAKVYTVRRARWITGTSNKYRAQMRFGDSGTANVTRRWGVGYGASMPTVTDGAYFSLTGTTFAINTMSNTTPATVNNGSFNGSLGATYTPTFTNNNTYEILYTLGKVYFFLNGSLLHTATFATTHWTYNTVTFHAFADVVNTGDSAAVTMTFRMMNISRLGNYLTVPQSYYYASGQTAGTQLKIGAGNIHSMIFGGAANNAVVTLADSTSGATPALWVYTATGALAAPVSIDFHGMTFVNGLRFVVATGNASFTIVYE